MNNKVKQIVATMALAVGVFSFATPLFAQDEEIKVSYDKYVVGPDENNVYTINLEAYVTGSVTVTTSVAPADIVLVLDYSGSMTYDFSGRATISGTSQRIYALRNAVKDFVDIVKESDGKIPEENLDDYGGHRIAFVLYGGDSYFTGTGLNTFIDVDNLTTGYNSSSNAGSVNYGSTNIIGTSTRSGGTPSDEAMEQANTLLSNEDYVITAPKRSRVVVFFTDGIPGEGRDQVWTDERREVADGCIDAANTIKNAENYSATVYSVGLFTAQASANETTTYLSFTSSDYDDKTELPEPVQANWVNVSGDKSFISSNSEQLKNVFSSIASSSGGNYDAASSSSLLVDVVTNSFSIPANTDLGTVKVYAVPCTQQSASSIISFDTVKEAYLLETVDNPEDIPAGKVCLQVDRDTKEVSVTGFDYGAEWCGWDGKANKVHGRKLVMQIPITVNENAIGGPAVQTNTNDSKLILRNAEGEEIASYELPKPVLPIPVSIWIEKHGLIDDDSAVFTLARAPYVKGASYDDYVTGTYKDSWESFTKVIVNEKNMQTVTVDGVEHRVVKISGLDPDYYYRIKEDAWAWGYPVQIDGVQYTIGDNIQNPLQVWNKPDPDTPKHAEAVVRNVFTERTTEWTTTSE